MSDHSTSPITRLSFRGPAEVADLRRRDVAALRRLMYISRAVYPASCTSEALKALAQKSRVNNERRGITGFLIYSAPFFLQVVEGPTEAVGALYAIVSKDLRHTNCTLVMDVLCTVRLYEQWHMQFEDMDLSEAPAIVNVVLNQMAQCFVGMWAYLPMNAASLLLTGKCPSKEPPQSLDAAVMFIHIVEYKTLLRRLRPLEQMADLLNAFVDICVSKIQGSGGQVAKFINGCCMAYWPDSLTPQAVQCICDIQDALVTLRGRRHSGAEALLHIVAGLHCGEALLCNAGSKRADFTLLGDSVNTAARLASLACKLNYGAVLSADVAALLKGSARERLENIGRQELQGRRKPVSCFRLRAPPVDVEALFALVECLSTAPLSSRSAKAAKPTMMSALDSHLFAEDHDSQLRLSSPRFKQFLSNLAAKVPSRWQGEDTDLVTLTYISHACNPLSRADLSAIQRHSFRANDILGITACLLYLDGVIAQTIEGPRKFVMQLFERIKHDARHTDVVMVHKAPVASRTYQEPFGLVSLEEQRLGSSVALQDVLAQLARSFVSLETYVPSVVLRHLMVGCDPRQMQPQHVPVVMLATDICGFTTLSEGCSLTGVWEVCTAFIDCCTAAIVAEGGEVLKLIGDCVTAYFPARAAGAALEAAQDIVQRCRQMREFYQGTGDCRSLIHCGVGLDSGLAMFTHSGSLQTRDVMVTGEVSVRVLQIEGLSRAAGRAIVMSAAVAEELPPVQPMLQAIQGPPGHPGEGISGFGLLGMDWVLNPRLVRRQIHQFREANAKDGELVSETSSIPCTEACEASQAEDTLYDSFTPRQADVPMSFFGLSQFPQQSAAEYFGVAPAPPPEPMQSWAFPAAAKQRPRWLKRLAWCCGSAPDT